MKVRIPIVVAADGRWAACGCSESAKADWEMLEEIANSGLPDTFYVHLWTEIDLPTRTESTVKSSAFEVDLEDAGIVEQ